VEIGLNPINSREGLLTLSVVVDITERKRHERLKNEFVATVSHELRTPLTSISGALGILASGAVGELSASAKRLLTIAHTNSERLARLINDILDIEKIEAGKLNFNLKPVSLRPLVEQVIEASRGFGDAYGVSIRFDSNSTEETALVDADRLCQVVTNLLSNAVKFSPRQSVVTVKIEGLDSGARITVRDQGRGIPEDYKERVFEKFVQVDATDAREKGGTGLGLSIVKQIVERLGGRVGFQPAPGGGTIFHVDLPKWDPDRVGAPIQEHGAPPRILLCEDDPETAAILGDHLRHAGFAIDVSYTAAGAVKDAATISYAAILVDLQLPDSDGITLIKQLRSQPHYHDTPIIVVSADPDRGRDDSRASTLNVLDWLAKPIDIDRLVRVLDRPIARLTSHGRPRILHVDADREVLRLVTEALGSSADVVSVESVSAARAVLRNDRFDLAVVDVALAEGFGLDLLLDLYDAEGHALPVVVFSAQDTPEVAARVLAVLNRSRASIDSLVATLRRLVNGPTLKRTLTKEVA
jgi:DNA-binding response OmpR family regulator/nitrogen-specific signal transduction histidine kinase